MGWDDGKGLWEVRVDDSEGCGGSGGGLGSCDDGLPVGGFVMTGGSLENMSASMDRNSTTFDL